MSCIPLPTSASNTVTTDDQDNVPNPSPTGSANDDTNGGISIDTNRTTATHVRSPVTTITTDNWPQTKAMNTSLTETTLIIFSVTPSVVVLMALVVVLTPTLIVAYRCVKRKKSKLLKQENSKVHNMKHAKVIQVGVDEPASQSKPTLNGHVVSPEAIGQETLNRRQHICARVASDTMAYNGQHDAASPEPEVVVMVDNNLELESSYDDERYTSMPFEHGHVTQSPLSCDGHVTDPTNHMYDTVDSQPLMKQSQHSPQMKRNQNPTINSVRSHSKLHNSSSPFQRSLTIGGVYSTRTTSSLQSFTAQSHRGSLTSSGTVAGVSQRMSGGRGSRLSHHRLSTAGGSSSRAGTSTQGSMTSGVLPTQE